MAQQTFSAHGFEYTFEDNTGEILKAFQNALERGLENIGQRGVEYAQENIRESRSYYEGKPSKPAIGTSELLQSINYKVVETDVYIGTDVEHGYFIEFGSGKFSTYQGGGTSKESWIYMDEFGDFHIAFPQMPRPFLKPAVSEHTQEYRDILEKSLGNA